MSKLAIQVQWQLQCLGYWALEASEVGKNFVSQYSPDKIFKKQHSLGFVFIDETLTSIVNILYEVSRHPK